MGLIFYNIQQEQAEDEVRDESGEEEESEEEEIEVPFFFSNHDVFLQCFTWYITIMQSCSYVALTICMITFLITEE